jgi:hypothetical protein
LTATERIVGIVLLGTLSLGGSTALVAAQSKALAIDDVPKRQLADTIREAPANQIFVFHGERMTKSEIVAKARENHARFVAHLEAARGKIGEVGRTTADRIAGTTAARKAELDAANVKASADLAAAAR